jgi:hypothetical protein
MPSIIYRTVAALASVPISSGRRVLFSDSVLMMATAWTSVCAMEIRLRRDTTLSLRNLNLNSSCALCNNPIWVRVQVYRQLVPCS